PRSYSWCIRIAKGQRRTVDSSRENNCLRSFTRTAEGPDQRSRGEGSPTDGDPGPGIIGRLFADDPAGATRQRPQLPGLDGASGGVSIVRPRQYSPYSLPPPYRVALGDLGADVPDTGRGGQCPAAYCYVADTLGGGGRLFSDARNPGAGGAQLPLAVDLLLDIYWRRRRPDGPAIYRQALQCDRIRRRQYYRLTPCCLVCGALRHWPPESTPAVLAAAGDGAGAGQYPHRHGGCGLDLTPGVMPFLFLQKGPDYRCAGGGGDRAFLYRAHPAEDVLLRGGHDSGGHRQHLCRLHRGGQDGLQFCHL